MNASLNWNANTEPDLAGYLVFHGIASGIYDPGITVLAPTTTYLFTGLALGIRHYFAVKAFDTTGNTSTFSAEVSKQEQFPVYALDTAVRVVVPSRLVWGTDTSGMVSGFLADVVGANVAPIPERVPIGGFMCV